MHNGVSLLTYHQNLLDIILPPQGFRRPITAMESATCCSVELIGGETDLELELLDPNNDIVLCVINRVSMPFNRHVGCFFCLFRLIFIH